MAYTMSSASLEAISLLGVFGPFGLPGSLYFLFRPISLIWLAVLVGYTYLWAHPGSSSANVHGLDSTAGSGPAAATV